MARVIRNIAGGNVVSNRAWWLIGLGAVLLLGASASTTPAFNTYPTTWERYPGPATDDANGQPTPRGPARIANLKDAINEGHREF